MADNQSEKTAKTKSQKRKRSIVAAVMLVICVALLVAMFTGRCSQADESLKAREQLGWYSVLVAEGEYSEDIVPTIYTTIGQRTLVDYYTTSGAGKYWSVYAYTSDTPQEDVDAYAAALIADEGFVRDESMSGTAWLERPYANGLTTVVTVYPNESGYEVWIGAQQGRRT